MKLQGGGGVEGVGSQGIRGGGGSCRCRLTPVDEGGISMSRSGHFNPVKEPTPVVAKTVWGPRTGLERCGKSLRYRVSNPGLPNQWPFSIPIKYWKGWGTDWEYVLKQISMANLHVSVRRLQNYWVLSYVVLTEGSTLWHMYNLSYIVRRKRRAVTSCDTSFTAFYLPYNLMLSFT